MKTAVISDTHDLLRKEVISIIKSCDAVIHAGDFCSVKTYEDIKSILPYNMPFYAVRGNNDFYLNKLPYSAEFALDGYRVYVTHKKEDIPKGKNADIYIFGHSHMYTCENTDGQIFLNPGSCGKKRFFLPITMAVLYTDNNGFRAERRNISSETLSDIKAPAELHSAVDSIMKGMKRGDTIDKISKKVGLDHAFVEETARIIVTHPEANVSDIVNKIEANNTINVNIV